jgi:hypothetical protein
MAFPKLRVLAAEAKLQSVQRGCLGKAQRATHKMLAPGAPRDGRAHLRCVLCADGGLLWGTMALVGSQWWQTV